QQADAEGRFVSYELDPGEARFEISHPDYESGVCSVQIEKPAAVPKGPAAPPSTTTPPTTVPANPPTPPLVPLRCELTAKPRAGSVRGTVDTEAGKAVAGARVELIGPASQSLTTDAQGQFAVVSLT